MEHIASQGSLIHWQRQRKGPESDCPHSSQPATEAIRAGADGGLGRGEEWGLAGKWGCASIQGVCDAKDVLTD